MFSKAIVNSARFLRMPKFARLLYYDLGMQADDEGFVEAFTVMRMTEAAEDDLKILAAKGFVKILNDDLVVFITDWNTNNVMRKDRRHESIYRDLFDIDESDCVNQPSTNCQPTVNQPSANCQHKLNESKLIEKKEKEYGGEKPARRSVKPTMEEVRAYCTERNNGIDAQHFFDFYEANGWMQGKGKPIKDWKAAVRTWEQNNSQRMQTAGTEPPEIKGIRHY